MANVGLLYVGAVLFINGMSLLGWVKGKSLAPMDLFVGILQVITPTYLIFTAHGNPAAILGASGLYLFGFTYLYVAMNNFFDLDPTGLGWFCLFVVLAAIVFAIFNFSDHTAIGNLLGVLWVSWAYLWLLFWLVLALGMTSLTRYTGAVCATQGIITGLGPAMVLLGKPEWVTNAMAIAIAAVGVILYLIYIPTVRTPRDTPATSSSPSSTTTAYG